MTGTHPDKPGRDRQPLGRWECHPVRPRLVFPIRPHHPSSKRRRHWPKTLLFTLDSGRQEMDLTGKMRIRLERLTALFAFVLPGRLSKLPPASIWGRSSAWRGCQASRPRRWVLDTSASLTGNMFATIGKPVATEPTTWHLHVWSNHKLLHTCCKSSSLSLHIHYICALGHCHYFHGFLQVKYIYIKNWLSRIQPGSTALDKLKQ